MTLRPQQIAASIAAMLVASIPLQSAIAATDKSDIPVPEVLSKDSAAAQSSANEATQAGATGTAAKATETATLYWYDGQRKRLLRLNPSALADFGEDSQKPAAQPKMIDQGEAGLSKELSKAGVSPMFEDAASGQGAGALPGGVMVRLLRPMTSDSAQAIARAFGSSVVRAIGSPASSGAHDFWLFDAPAGLAALELANRIHESGQVSSASPNWWKPRQLK